MGFKMLSGLFDGENLGQDHLGTTASGAAIGWGIARWYYGLSPAEQNQYALVNGASTFFANNLWMVVKDAMN